MLFFLIYVLFFCYTNPNASNFEAFHAFCLILVENIAVVLVVVIVVLFLCFALVGRKMSTLEMSHVDLEQGNHRRSVVGSDVSGEGSVCFSDADDVSCYSRFYSTNGGSYDDYSFACVSDPEVGGVAHSGRASSVSECSVEVETRTGVPEIKVHLSKVERDCRICHMGLESDSHESGAPIELGCSCKDDLAAAHKHCAEAWFKIKGNR